METTPTKGLTILAFTNIYVIWGITFLAIAFGLEGFPPFILSGLRFFGAGFLILGWLTIKGERPTSFKSFFHNSIAGILILTGGTGLVAWGEQYVSASEAAIAIATGPFWFIAIDRKNWKLYFSDKFIPIGLLLGFTGLIVFLGGSVSSPTLAPADASLRITAFIVLALSSIAWVFGSLYSRNKAVKDQTRFMNVAQQLTSAGIASFLIALFRGEWTGFSFADAPISAWAGLLFLILFGSIVAYISYIWLLSFKPAALVSTHTYINPIVAVLAGWILKTNDVNTSQLIGLGIILLGVLLTNVTKYIHLSSRSKVKIRQFWRIWTRVANPYRISYK